MSKEKETPTITMTEEQLEIVIETAVKKALLEVKKEDIKRNEIDEGPDLLSAVAMMLYAIYLTFLIIEGVVIFKCVQFLRINGFDLRPIGIGFAAGCAIIVTLYNMMCVEELKKIDELNLVYSSIIATVAAIISLIGVVFAYKAL